MQQHWLVLIDALFTARNALHVETALGGFAASLGVKYFAFASAHDGTVEVISNYPKEWKDRYLEQRYASIDPVVTLARKSRSSVRWSTDHMKPHSPTEDRFIAEGRSFGIRSGVSLSALLPYGHTGLLTLATDVKKMPEIMAAHIPSASIAMGSMDATLRATPSIEFSADTISLSLRQRQCLEWASRGKTAGVIASILGISEHAVTLYLKEARKKLDVRNLPHAVRLAIERGVISGGL